MARNIIDPNCLSERLIQRMKQLWTPKFTLLETADPIKLLQMAVLEIPEKVELDIQKKAMQGFSFDGMGELGSQLGITQAWLSSTTSPDKIYEGTKRAKQQRRPQIRKTPEKITPPSKKRKIESLPNTLSNHPITHCETNEESQSNKNRKEKQEPKNKAFDDLTKENEHSSRVAFIGPSGCGKTVAAMNYIETNLHKYQRVFIFSSTCQIDPAYKNLLSIMPTKRIAKNLENIHDSLQNLGTVFCHIKQKTKKGCMERTLVIIDDLVHQFKNNQPLIEMFVAGRHHNISLVIMTQVLVLLPPEVRKNLTHAAIFKLPRKELRCLKDEWSEEDNKLESAYSIATASSHGFLWMQCAVPREYFTDFNHEPLII